MSVSIKSLPTVDLLCSAVEVSVHRSSVIMTLKYDDMNKIGQYLRFITSGDSFTDNCMTIEVSLKCLVYALLCECRQLGLEINNKYVEDEVRRIYGRTSTKEAKE